MMTEGEEESAAAVTVSPPAATRRTPEDYYTTLITESPLIYGDHGIPPVKLDLPNSDLNCPQLIQEGKDFVKRNFYSVMLAHLVSLMWVFTFKPGRAVLLRTGESHSREASLPRYLSTVLHIKLWYESDFIERQARGSQDLYAVRKMHAAAARNYKSRSAPEVPELTEKQRKILEAVRRELATVDESNCPVAVLTEDPTVPMSQFDMVITQFCFIGFIVLMPKSFGLYDSRGIEGFMHLWKIFGRQLGIEDRFNLAIHYEESGGDLTAFRRIFYDIFLPNLKNTDEMAVVMWDSLMYGCSQYVKELRLVPMIKFLLTCTTEDGREREGTKGSLKPVMSARDKMSYKFFIFVTRSWGKVKFFNVLRNREIRVKFHRAQRKYLPNWQRQPQQSCPSA